MKHEVSQLHVADRDAVLHSLSNRDFDLAVIGGGIVGISVAWTATLAGMRVCLLDKGDFVSATSTASTKLIHGGLRYLKTGHIGKVAENHQSRRRLATSIAPNFVEHKEFLLPIYRGGPFSRVELSAALLAYSALSGFTDGIGHVISSAEALELVPDLVTKDLLGSGKYVDHQMNDGRLAVAVLQAAVAAGAVAANYARVTSLGGSATDIDCVEFEDEISGDCGRISTRFVVNATGPWLDRIRRLEYPQAKPSIRLSKGTHVIVPLPENWRAGVTIPVDRQRVSFAIPWEGQLLLGTTDEEFDGDLAHLSPTPEEITQVLREAGTAIEGLPDTAQFAYCGVRVLPIGLGSSSAAPRELIITRGPRGMISVAGGKWTTFVNIGRSVVKEIGIKPPPLDSLRVLSAGSLDSIVTELSLKGFPPDVALYLARNYGTEAFRLASIVDENADLGSRIDARGPDIWAQVVLARDREWAVTVDDVTRRRTTLAYRGLASLAVESGIRELLNS